MSSHDSSWSTGSLASYLESVSAQTSPLQPVPRKAQPGPLSLTHQHHPSDHLTPFPPPTPSGSISEAGMSADVSAMLQQTAAPLTPAPSPGQAASRRLWEERDVIGGPSSGEGRNRLDLEDGMRSLWEGVETSDRSPGMRTVGEGLGSMMDPQSLIDHFQTFTPSQRYAFLSLLVPSLRLNEALIVSRKIEPRMRRDFLRDLPGELALHCMSFITDAHTLTQAAQVSRHWYRLLQDEQTWKDMCLWHRFTPIVTPLSSRRSNSRWSLGAPLAGGPAWGLDQPIWGADAGIGLGVRGVIGGQEEHDPAIVESGSARVAVVGPDMSHEPEPEAQYYVPLSMPLGLHPSLRGFGRQDPGFKAQFKDAYQTQRNWLQGGRVLKQFIAISEDDGVVTSLAINNHHMIVGMANSRIHIFDAHNARFRHSLVGHERGVWTLVLVSPAIPEPGDDDYDVEESARFSAGSTRRDVPHLTSSQFGLSSTRRISESSPRRVETNTEISESAYTSIPPSVGFDPTSTPPFDSSNPSTSNSRYAFGPTHFGAASSSTSSHPPIPPSSFPGVHRSGTSAGSGGQYNRSRKGDAPVYPAKRMRSSDICGSARGWSSSGMGARHLVVSGGCDRQVKVWDVDTGACVHSLSGHNSTIRCLKVLDRRPIAISGSRDNSLRVWDIHKGVLLRQLVGHTGSVRCVEIAGNMAVSGSYDNTARVWNVDTGECIHVLHGHYHQIYSCAFDGERIITGSLDSTVRVWSAATGDCLALLQGHTSLVGQIQLIGDRLLTGGSDGRVIVFDLSTYECLHRLCAHDNSVTCLQFDDRFVISGGMDGRVKLWDIRTGAFIRELTKPCTSIWRIGCRDDRVVILAQRETRTVLEVLSFRPGEVVGRSLVV